MAQSTAPVIDPSGAWPASRRRRARVAWIGGLTLILLAVGVGRSIEGELAANGMPDLAGAPVTLAQLVPLLFAFAFPLGLACCAYAAMGSGPKRGLGLPVVLGIGAVAVAAPVLVPAVLGRGLVAHHFGIGGVVITVAALATFAALGRLRGDIPAAFVPALDLTLLGALCLAAAAWNLCGSAAMPSFLLMPERMQALGTLPFAIGQMKSVLALLALGWALLMAAAMLAASRLRPTVRHD